MIRQNVIFQGYFKELRKVALLSSQAGKPIAWVTAIDAPEPMQIRRLGCLAGQFVVPEDFDRMGQEEILAQFGLDE